MKITQKCPEIAHCQGDEYLYIMPFSPSGQIYQTQRMIYSESVIYLPPPPLEEISSNEFKKISTLKTPAECTTAERRNELSQGVKVGT